MNFNDEKISYVILPGGKWTQTISYLYSMDYTIVEMLTSESNISGKSIFTYNSLTNQELKKDTLFVLDHFEMDYAYIKYEKTNEIFKITKEGRETPVEVLMYESSLNTKRFILGEISFSFKDLDKYRLVESKSELTQGVEVEYFNNNKWNKKIVENIDDEWNGLYALLSKYKKLRMVD
jgi:hypothetical protein